MKKLYIGLSLCLALGMAFDTFAQSAVKDTHDEIAQTAKASTVFREIMSAPDKAIPRRVLDERGLRGGIPAGHQGCAGRRRTRRSGRRCHAEPQTGWSAPAYLNVGGGSFGFQIGVESTDYVMLFMTPESARSLLQSNFKLGGNMSVAAGPIGREAEAATDLKLNAQILSYSRSKGLFAGSRSGRRGHRDGDGDMNDVYGPNVTAKAVLVDGSVKAPQEVTAFAKTLESYTTGMRGDERHEPALIAERNTHRACRPDQVEIRRYALLFAYHLFERHRHDVGRL